MNRKRIAHENCILTLAVMAAGILFMGYLFDFYYDLNDDTMMHDIMSGVYSGTPDGHNMQTLYPLGALIALGYRLCRRVPWYGLFLCGCQFGSFYLVGVRLCELADGWKENTDGGRSGGYGSAGWKIVLLALLTLFMWGVFLPHLIYVQYTVTCAVMSAAAIFLFLTTGEGLGIGAFVKKNIPAILLVIVAYQLRTEMLLLTFPFICLAGLYRMTEEKNIFAKENLCRYGAVLGIMLVGMLCFTVADIAAYGSAEWRDFRKFFEARTTVYDFYQELVTDERYAGELAGLGVMPHQQELLCNYNFGLDDSIDTAMVSGLADYAEDTLGAEKDWIFIAGESLRDYYYRTFHRQDMPYNMLALWGYGAVFAVGACSFFCRRRADGKIGKKASAYALEQNGSVVRNLDFLWQPALLLAVRSAVWLFILMRGRAPERITHSLYLVESALLAAMFVRLQVRNRMAWEAAWMKTVFSGTIYGFTILFIFITAYPIMRNVVDVRAEQARREQVNADWYAIDTYCKAQGGNFYFEDVYSTVGFSHKMFAYTDTGYANYDIMGGWMCKSPLYYDKLKTCGIGSAGEALLEKEGAFFIMSDEEYAQRGIAWIADYYAAGGIAVTLEEKDRINENYRVYEVHRADHT